ncbi:MAG TPA: LLM class flavin-dependent oxidoreductase [Candidatus Dormibacteraeota bacterium]
MVRLAVVSNAAKTIADSVDRARAAESLGVESIWVTQLPDYRDMSLVLAAYAAATERVALGTGVLPIYTRHPTAMVQMAASLDELSAGRFILGMGISHRVTVETMWGLRLEHPVDSMREYLTIVRTSLRDGGCDFQGTHFSASWRYSGPRRPDMKVMISALHPRMLELAGEMADGVVLGNCPPDYIRDSVVPALMRGREKAGKTLDGFEVVAIITTSLTADRPAALDVFRKTMSFYSNLPFYRKVLDQSGFKAQLEAGEVSDAMLDELGGVGDERQVREAVERYRAAGVTLPAVFPFANHAGAAGFEATLEAALRA